jgi:Asp-tRNA(Asn)/Glu-tRNA(Gln) amidotransferase A subunit family amidase
VVGFKPSYDRVSRRGIRPLSWSLDTLAVHARSVADVDLVLGALGGGMASASASVKGARLGLVTELVDLAEPELAQRINDTAVQMAGCGATVAEVRLPYANADMLAVHHVVQQVEAVAAHRPLFSRHADGYPPRLRAYLEVGQFLPASAYIEAQRLRRRMFDAIDSLFEGVDALLLPTARGPAPEASTTGSYVMLAAWSLLGLPAITIPAGLSATNLPLAIQLVGRHGADAALLHVAELCETVIGRLGVPDLSAEIQRAIA